MGQPARLLTASSRRRGGWTKRLAQQRCAEKRSRGCRAAGWRRCSGRTAAVRCAAERGGILSGTAGIPWAGRRGEPWCGRGWEVVPVGSLLTVPVDRAGRLCALCPSWPAANCISVDPDALVTPLCCACIAAGTGALHAVALPARASCAALPPRRALHVSRGSRTGLGCQADHRACHDLSCLHAHSVFHSAVLLLQRGRLGRVAGCLDARGGAACR